MTANNRQRAHPGAPSLIEHKNLKFVIVNKPSQSTLPQFVKEMKKHGVKVVVRCCDPTYSTESLKQEGITVVDYPFEDGAAPPVDVITRWLRLVIDTFKEDGNNCIAVHCVAGLGRAPVLVAIALIEYGMKYSDAVEHIRQKRRGAINQRQLEFLEHYRPTNKHSTCCIM